MRSVGLLKDPAGQARLAECLGLARQLAVSYVGLTQIMEMFPQVSRDESRLVLEALGVVLLFPVSPASEDP